ncbi:MAG: 4a-hydroxytetrahydrobiopterin dehydratase [Flavobacteriales bacterium]|nr:4a-hydroxytetrahydrobiopterin dehydratase [Flavobacteriales bacterium]
MKTYTEEEVIQKLKAIEGWELNSNKIVRDFKFKSFGEALAFMVKVGIEAEKSDHHSEIYNVYNRVKLSLNTHSEGGITEKDFSLARSINTL